MGCRGGGGEGGAGAPESGVTPAPGGASALFLGLHAGSASASHTFRQCTWPDGEVACAVHSPSPPVASRGDVSICKVQVSASSFLGAVCATGAQVGARRLRPGAWEGRLCRKGRWSSQPSRLGALVGPRGSGQQCFLRGGPGAASGSARAPAVSAWGGGAQSRSSPSPGAACCVSLVTRLDSAKRCRASQQRPLPAAGHVESDPWQWREDKWREECATAWDPAAQSPGLSHLVLTAARRAGGAAACFPEAGGGGSQRVTSPYHMAGSSRRPRSSGEGATLSLSHPTPWGVLLVPGNFAIETRNASILSFMHSKNMKAFISN